MFYAHPTSKATLEAAASSPNRREDAPPVIIPTELVEEEKVLTLGGREIRILFLGRAHTGGDLHVYLPEEKLLFMSESCLRTGSTESTCEILPFALLRQDNEDQKDAHEHVKDRDEND